MFNGLIIFRILFSLKSKVPSLDWVENIWLIGSTLSFFKGVHCYVDYWLGTKLQEVFSCIYY